MIVGTDHAAYEISLKVLDNGLIMATYDKDHLNLIFQRQVI